jgi:hypothetical protein
MDGMAIRPLSEKTNVAVWTSVVTIAGMLLAPAIWNGFPLLQYDTGGYLARWYEGYLVPSRPGAYGLMLAASVSLYFWPVLLVQVALTVWVLALLLRCLGFVAQPLTLLATVSLLSVATSLPWLTAILLTDIFAGLSVLALFLVVFCGNNLGRWEGSGLVALTEFDNALSAWAAPQAGGFVMQDHGFLLANSDTIAALAIRHRLVSIGPLELPTSGGLFGYGVKFSDFFRRAAFFVDKILKGTKPGDIPIEQAAKFKSIVNLKTAKMIGIDLPTSILLRAEEVIE